jgi:quercetin dioxygenase-like cupin family protein
MALRYARIVAMAALLATAAGVGAGEAASTMVVTQSTMQWKDLGNGVAAAPVSGDMEKGASRFFLKYPVGLVTPKHHHDADHYGTIVSGSVTLTVDGKSHLLGPGDYFALTSQASHTAKVEGSEAAVFFIQADGPWNVVMEP